MHYGLWQLDSANMYMLIIEIAWNYLELLN